MSEALLPSTLARRLLVLTTAVLVTGAVYGCGVLQAQEAPDDNSYALDRIREVGGPVGVPFASTGRVQQLLDASLPRTGFEQRGGASWTTLGEEQQFLSQLDTASDRVRVSILARTQQNRPIRLVVAGPPLTNAEIRARGAILFVCTQHGNEPAGREACLQLARNHAASASTTSLLIIPTANPDGVAAGTRTNAAGTDINRDHARLGSREARVISQVLRDFLPSLVSDMHEHIQPASADMVLLHPGSFFSNADAAIVQQSSDANTLYLIPDLNAAGFATGFFHHAGPPPVTPQSLAQMAALRHAPVVLIETPRTGTLSPLQRVGAQLTSAGALLRMWSERQSTLKSTCNASAQRATEKGAAGGSRYYFTYTIYTDVPPCGYQLSTAQYDRWKPRLDLFGVKATARNAGWAISMAQRAQPFIGLLLDSRAAEEFTAGQPLSCP